MTDPNPPVQVRPIAEVWPAPAPVVRPYYHDEAVGITIYLGDCREILPSLSRECASVLLTDPPYGIVNRFGSRADSNGGVRTMQFEWDHAGVHEEVESGIAEGVAALTKVASCFIFSGLDLIGSLVSIVRAAGFVVKPAAWAKECPPPAGKGNWWPSAFELAFYGYRGSAPFFDADKKRSNLFYADSYRFGQPGKVGHPTQKPLSLITRLARTLIAPGATAIDPFMGSGTTLVAAKSLGRSAIGIDIEERYCEMAVRRLAQEVLPFGAQE